jgi:phenylalanyl-tRNA synthetase beta chain
MFSQYCADKFTYVIPLVFSLCCMISMPINYLHLWFLFLGSVEPVQVIQHTGEATIYPDLSPRVVRTTASYINTRVGVQLSSSDIVSLLTRMGLTARHCTTESSLAGQLTSNKLTVDDGIEALVPATRSDILHACDVSEDVAIAYGFNNIVETTPRASTVGAALPVNKLTDLLRREVALSGYTEVLPLILVK